MFKRHLTKRVKGLSTMNSIYITLFHWSAEFTKISRDGAILICAFGMSTLMVQIEQHSLATEMQLTSFIT